MNDPQVTVELPYSLPHSSRNSLCIIPTRPSTIILRSIFSIVVDGNWLWAIYFDAATLVGPSRSRQISCEAAVARIAVSYQVGEALQESEAGYRDNGFRKIVS